MTSIPPITEPMGRYWNQPPVDDILVDETCAMMTAETLTKLACYDTSQPSGVYDGKMWRSKTEIVMKKHPTAGPVPQRIDRDRLWWFGPSASPGQCSVNHRPVIIV